KGAIVRYGNEDPNRVISIEELEINELTETSKNPDGSTVEKTTTRIIESCEESMIRSHRRRKFDEDTKVALEHDSNSWDWLIAWYDMVPLPSMIVILEKYFFPKWLQVLNIWLSTNTNSQEIQRWYIGWRSLIPQAIINHTIIKKILTEGLMMIDRKISGTLNIQQTSASQSSENVIYNAHTLRNLIFSVS
ncbi:unnamed protein product, partial [Rotaria socialis]